MGPGGNAGAFVRLRPFRHRRLTGGGSRPSAWRHRRPCPLIPQPFDRVAQAGEADAMRRLTALLVGSFLLIACQAQQANLLTDPSAILQAAASTTAAAKTVHIDVSADGPIAIDPLGTGAGAAVNLKGTNAAIDADLATSKLHATFLSPNLLNLSAEVITTDGSTYLKSSLTGPKFLVTATPV